ncbi:ATP-dependent Clp endopeptidase proteolytic subunit ClpP [Virgisporangium ochraceum]|uniref:ATP-dependent Clp protease proteolytic subunit n=1 Tax=Virgisporangium ochraceum TaxID=65505 RepID=A0A8J3ZTK2_9ACTN|nr:ATP-dependent Clp protease proteolytic subunit [Virgisporangium ochraceum]GIJ67265.1 ATP-dependent Clp protease proteolytic subunit [Virgisporangium ochraceum]
MRENRPMPGPSEGVAPWLAEKLFDRRVVMLTGVITGGSASQAAASLLTLDALGTEPVHLHLSAPEGDLNAAFAVVDAVDAMRCELHATVTGEAGGAAVAVLAAAHRRLAYRHARIRLTEPRSATVAGTADEVASAAGRYLRELEELAVRLAEVTGQARSRIESDLSAGKMLTAAEAVEYGLVHQVVGRNDRAE